MKRPDLKSAAVVSGVQQCSDDVFQRKYPTIVSYLMDEKYDDGSVREPSALSISVRDGLISLALNDKDVKASLYTQASTLNEALKLMEGVLADGSAPWRPWKAGKKK